MMESRCGILCSACEYREQMHCAGCANIKEPFWGACKIKTCCEGRKLPHCGECPQFPCANLKAFAYDKEQGDDGKRLEQCQAWQKAAPRYRTTLVAVADMARAKAFYTGLLGLTIVEDIGANVTLAGGITLQELGSWKGLLGTDAVTLRHHAGELYFEVQDMDAFVAHAAQFGVDYFQPLNEAPWGQRLLRLNDPDGNLIEVGEDMHIVTRRFLDSGMSVEQAAQRMGVPAAYVEAYR